MSINCSPQVQKPNIILLLADDLGYKALKCNGGNLYSTPNLDTLAKKGMRFTQCHSSPLCAPSRQSLLTGKYNFRNYTDWGYLRADQKTIGNMLKKAGYKTAYYGKWHLNGGDKSIRNFGFTKYCVWGPFKDTAGGRYKSPLLYANSNYIPSQKVINKYGPDILLDSAIKFIELNKSNPFFIYFSSVLTHYPFQPTPDDSNYNNPASQSDTAYFASMIKYLDKQIGKLVNTLKQLGIENNTLILFTGDNGTPAGVLEYKTGDSGILGAKASTKEGGTKVPLIAYWPNVIQPNSINNNLVDFTDFLPSFANIANISIPDYGPLDGVSFAEQLKGHNTTARQWIFNYYRPYPKRKQSQSFRWAQTATYKLYDTSTSKKQREFYNIQIDPEELNPLTNEKLTNEEKAIKQQLQHVINNYIEQGIALLDPPKVLLSTITDSSCAIYNYITSDGGSTIIASGAVWDTSHNPRLENGNHTNENNPSYKGRFQSFINGLSDNTGYYVRSYAKNAAGTVYSKEVSFVTPLKPPLALPASHINSNGFLAKWDSINAADCYKVDVSTYNEFSIPNPLKETEGFANSNAPEGWVFSNTFTFDTVAFGKASPAIQFKSTNQSIITKTYNGKVKELKFWLKSHIKNSANSLIVQGLSSNAWKTIDTIKNISQKAFIKKYDSSHLYWDQNFRAFRFKYIRGNSYISFDDVEVNYIEAIPSFVSGYHDKSVTKASLEITGLEKNKQYFYRVRAVNVNGTSGYSNTVAAATFLNPVISGINVTNPDCFSANTGSINVNVTGKADSYWWTGPDNFTSSDSSIKNLAAGTYKLVINPSSVQSVDTTITLTSPPPITAVITGDSEIYLNNTAILFVTAQGGTGSYWYSLFNGVNTKGPQLSNQFKTGTGIFRIIIEDSNQCSFTTNAFEVKGISCDISDATTTFSLQAFPNPADNEFNLNIKPSFAEQVTVVVTDAQDKRVYYYKGKNLETYRFGKNFTRGTYFVRVLYNKEIKTIKLFKAGK